MNKIIQHNKNFFVGRGSRGSRGLTMLELMLVVGIMGVFAASSAPYVMRSIGWMHQSFELEQDYYKLYEASLLISRYIGSGGNLSAIQLVGNELKAEGSVLVRKVTAWQYSRLPNLPNAVYICDLTVEGSGGDQSVRFVVSGFE